MSQMNCLKNSGLDLKFNEPLSEYTTLKIGGAADILIKPQTVSELENLIKLLLRQNNNFFILGCGSNLLISETGFRGIVITLRQGEFLKIENSGSYLKAGAGVKLSALLGWCIKSGLGGLEFMAGIPASLGGAIKQNAGTNKNTIADVLEDVTYLDKEGKIRTAGRGELDFSYRGLKLDFSVITAATLKLPRSSPAAVAGNIRSFFNLKREKQPLGKKSAGCIFKNPPGQSAGFLIESAGLKGKRCGHAYVSEKHANFIINENKAAFGDVLSLMELIKREVRIKKNTLLEAEVEILL